MAVVNKPLEQKQQVNPYAGMDGVSTNTAQRLGNAQQKYQASDAVNQAQQTWQQIQQQKPGAFKSRYTDILNGVLNQIQNPQEFKYEFNGDGLFRSYADEYTQRGKQASLDAMGQAAGLTGGYGNSYAQQVGQQTYQNWLLGLYDKGMDLRDRAYGQFQDARNDLKDRYNIFSSAENTDYGRYRDLVGDWTNQEQNAYNRFLNERDYDYNNYMNDLNYWTGLAEIENRAYTTEQERQEAIRQYNQDYELRKAQFDEDKRRYDQEWAHQMALEEAAAAAAAAAPAYNPGKNIQEVYPVGDKYYAQDSTGNLKQIEKPEGEVKINSAWQDLVDDRARKQALRNKKQ